MAYLQKRSRLKRYGLPIILTATIFPMVTFLLYAYYNFFHSKTLSFLIFILIVVTSSWYGGLGPGIFATVLAGSVGYFTFLRGDFPSSPAGLDLFVIFIYMMVGFLISIISEARYELEVQKDQFIALVAHELKNPLSVIQGFAQLLHQHFQKNGKGKIVRYTEEIGIQAEKLLELINDLLDVTKMEIDKVTYKEGFFDFDNLVEEVVNNQQIINSRREIILAGSSNKIIKGDKFRIGQVITNLLTNAIKYSPPDSPIKIKIRGKKEGVILTVKDYGIGIPKSEQKAIFNQFYRSRTTKHGKVEGLGLGLFISSQIIKHHQGKLSVKSNGRKGSVFYLEIPKNY